MARTPVNFDALLFNNNNNVNLDELLNAINNDTIRATPLYPTLYSIVVESGDRPNLSAMFKVPVSMYSKPTPIRMKVAPIVPMIRYW